MLHDDHLKWEGTGQELKSISQPTNVSYHAHRCMRLPHKGMISAE